LRKINDECRCYLQENENLEISRNRRSKASKTYQKCRKLRTKKAKVYHCANKYDRLKKYAKRAIKQRILRNKKRTDCSQAKILFKNWKKKSLSNPKKN